MSAVAGLKLKDVANSDTAVFVGAFNQDYLTMMGRDPGLFPTYKATGVGPAFLSNQISHWFDLKGPSVTSDTGCSGSLTAFHMACSCIRRGDSQMAIVSGASLMLDPDAMLALSTQK